jgi:hypothetical protein
MVSLLEAEEMIELKVKHLATMKQSIIKLSYQDEFFYEKIDAIQDILTLKKKGRKTHATN